MPETKYNQRAVFFDRDGVLNQLVPRDGSYYSPQKFKDFYLVDELIEVVNHIHKMGFLAIVVSNQPDISRGKLKQSELNKMTALLIEKSSIDDVFYCTHDGDNDIGCRKPAPGLFFIAQNKYNIEFKKSFMIGDTWKDVEAAKNAGIPMILLDKDYNQDIEEVVRVNSLLEAVSLIKNGFQ